MIQFQALRIYSGIDIITGTISRVEDRCRAILDQHAWEQNPIRFLIIDLALVGGLDLSAAEAFVRVHRMLVAKRVILVFCGQSPTSDVAIALQAVGLWSGGAQTFATLNEVRKRDRCIAFIAFSVHCTHF